MVLLVPFLLLIQQVPLVQMVPSDQGHPIRPSLQDCLLILLNRPILETHDVLLVREALACLAVLFSPAAHQVHLSRALHLGHLRHLCLAIQAILWDQVDL